MFLSQRRQPLFCENISWFNSPQTFSVSSLESVGGSEFAPSKSDLSSLERRLPPDEYELVSSSLLTGLHKEPVRFQYGGLSLTPELSKMDHSALLPMPPLLRWLTSSLIPSFAPFLVFPAEVFVVWANQVISPAHAGCQERIPTQVHLFCSSWG